jgi:hypothetical protein
MLMIIKVVSAVGKRRGEALAAAGDAGKAAWRGKA